MKSIKDFQKYKSIIFDCDGVILQSNKLKTEAFKESLKGEKHYLVKTTALLKECKQLHLKEILKKLKA